MYMDNDVVNLPVSRKESDTGLQTKLQSSQKYTVWGFLIVIKLTSSVWLVVGTVEIKIQWFTPKSYAVIFRLHVMNWYHK